MVTERHIRSRSRAHFLSPCALTSRDSTLITSSPQAYQENAMTYLRRTRHPDPH